MIIQRLLPSLAELTIAADVAYHAMLPTPQYSWATLNQRLEVEVWIKHENHTPIGAFKVRGGLVLIREFDVRKLKREPQAVRFGDKGYISQKLFESLFAEDVQLSTKLKTNMKNKWMPMFDKIMTRKRALIESVNDQLKNISQIEHTRHRRTANFFVNLMAGLVAYTFREKKPSLGIRVTEQLQLPVLVF